MDLTLYHLQDFLSACGRRISRLDVECGPDTLISCEDLVSVSRHCSQLESLVFTNFHVLAEVDPRVSHCPVPLTPAKFPFLRNVRLSNVVIDDFGKDVFRYLIGGAHDIESLYVSFKVLDLDDFNKNLKEHSSFRKKDIFSQTSCWMTS